MKRASIHVLAVAAALLAMAAQAVAAPDVPALCRVPDWMTDDLVEFPNSLHRVAADRRLDIVAIGASSTQGTGASGPAAAWPARLEALLSERLPGIAVRVSNLGRRSQTARIAVDRFANDVLKLHPSLVIWDTGTVEAARAEDPGEFAEFVHQGTELIGVMNADLVLMDPQYARDTARVINFQPYVDAMHQAAGLASVNLFPRHEIMRYWAEWGRLEPKTRQEMIKGNDQIYDCIAQLLAEVIDRGLKRPAHAQRR